MQTTLQISKAKLPIPPGLGSAEQVWKNSTKLRKKKKGRLPHIGQDLGKQLLEENGRHICVKSKSAIPRIMENAMEEEGKSCMNAAGRRGQRGHRGRKNPRHEKRLGTEGEKRLNREGGKGREREKRK